jgi:hypothetical protein
MGWAVGYDSNWHRDVGYGVPAKCDHPDCDKDIDRGLGYVCGGDVYGGEDGCGLFFCGEHARAFKGLCERCDSGADPFTPKPDTREWIEHKLTCPTWQRWRDDNPQTVDRLKNELQTPDKEGT